MEIFRYGREEKVLPQLPNGRIEKVLSGLPLFKYAARFTNTGTTNDYNVLHYNMENTAELAGSPLTLSFYIRGTDGKTVITTLGSANYSINITKQWTKHVCSIGSVAFGEHFRRGVAFNTLNQNFAANEYFEIAAVKIELGNTATPYVPRSYGEELALCKRYYEKIDRYDGLFCEMAGMIISNMRFSDKRTVPKISFTDSDGKQRYIDYYPSDGNWLKLKTSDSDARTDAFQFQLLNRSDISAKPAVGHIVARNLEFDAEIY